jgi:uncharacterized protein
MTTPTPTAAELMQHVLQAIATRDVSALLDLCADEIVFEFPFAPPGRPGRVEGKGPLGDYLAAIPSKVDLAGLSNFEMHQTVNPDVAIVEMTATGTLKGSGEPYEQSYVVVLTARNGRIVRYRDYWNPLKALDLG